MIDAYCGPEDGDWLGIRWVRPESGINQRAESCQSESSHSVTPQVVDANSSKRCPTYPQLEDLMSPWSCSVSPGVLGGAALEAFEGDARLRVWGFNSVRRADGCLRQPTELANFACRLSSCR